MDVQFLTGLLLINAVLASSCRHGWVSHGNSCYHVSRDKASWIEAQKMCEEHGAVLAHVDTRPEDAFIANLLRNTMYENDFWIAGSDWTTQGEWVWEPEGIPLLYKNWALFEPNNLGLKEHCIAMRAFQQYKWSDADCISKFNYVCEESVDISATTLRTPVETAEMLATDATVID